MGAVRDENFFVVHGWMINRLELKGIDLRLYAIIYGFSQNDGQKYHGNLQYLIDWTASSKSTVLRSLQTLVERGVLVKTDFFSNGVKSCEYHCNLNFTRCQNETGCGVKMTPGQCQNETGGGVKMTPNNIRDKDIDGSGIGLSIAKLLAINLGMKIDAICEDGETKFKIIIPNKITEKIIMQIITILELSSLSI